jgi:hypothetical protein
VGVRSRAQVLRVPSPELPTRPKDEASVMPTELEESYQRLGQEIDSFPPVKTEAEAYAFMSLVFERTTLNVWIRRERGEFVPM